MDWNRVNTIVADRYISCRKHPAADLYIYNYTQKTQWEGLWTPETKACRGLITDGNQRVVARPFEKFFNIEQHASLPNEPFDVYEKLDGSLGIMYFLGGKPQIATRGSFDSPQAIEANRLLEEKYSGVRFDPSLTYLFEVIFPENRIVVNYGKRRELVLLAVIDTDNGYELGDIDQLECVVNGGLPVVEWVPGRDGVDGLAYLKAMEEPNKEGFVIRYASGLRVKLKFDDYKRLHKLLTGINDRHIWEHLRAGTFDRMLEHTPDEFMGWARGVEAELRGKFATIIGRCQQDMRRVRAAIGTELFSSRKAVAEVFKSCEHPSVLFKMLDNRPYEDMVWRLIEPAGGRAFKIDAES